jgi:ribose transport system substrate-binding protein
VAPVGSSPSASTRVRFLIDVLRSGQLEGIVVQNPMRMGYLGVKTMVDHLRGRGSNLDSPEVKDLVDPPIARYLQGGSSG